MFVTNYNLKFLFSDLDKYLYPALLPHKWTTRESWNFVRVEFLEDPIRIFWFRPNRVRPLSWSPGKSLRNLVEKQTICKLKILEIFLKILFKLLIEIFFKIQDVEIKSNVDSNLSTDLQRWFSSRCFVGYWAQWVNKNSISYYPPRNWVLKANHSSKSTLPFVGFQQKQLWQVSFLSSNT